MWGAGVSLQDKMVPFQSPVLSTTFHKPYINAQALITPNVSQFFSPFQGTVWWKLLAIPILNTSVMVYSPWRDNYKVQNHRFL